MKPNLQNLSKVADVSIQNKILQEKQKHLIFIPINQMFKYITVTLDLFLLTYNHYNGWRK